MKRLGYAVVALSLGLVPAYGFVFEGWFVAKVPLEEHVATVASHLELIMPENDSGDAAAPVAILMPGCFGTRAFHRTWAAHFAEAGWAGVIVDSFTPRGLLSIDAREPVCEGARPWGFERAADLVAALQIVRADAKLDSQRIVLVGWSHGGWAIMDALTFGRSSRRNSLRNVPADWAEGLVGVALFYPYCGFGSRTRWHGWSFNVPVRMYFGDADSNVPIGPCQKIMKDLSSGGRDAKLTIFENQGHWFDNPNDSDFSGHVFDAATTDIARRDLTVWMDSLALVQKP